MSEKNRQGSRDPAHWRFVLSDNEQMVLDVRTELIWQRSVSSQLLEYDAASPHGWMLPSASSLLSLVDSRFEPMIHPEVFPNCPAKAFWSGTREDTVWAPTHMIDYYYVVDFSNGNKRSGIANYEKSGGTRKDTYYIRWCSSLVEASSKDAWFWRDGTTARTIAEWCRQASKRERRSDAETALADGQVARWISAIGESSFVERARTSRSLSNLFFKPIDPRQRQWGFAASD